MKKEFSLVFLLFISITVFSQDKKLPAGWDVISLDNKTAYMNLITGSISKKYPTKAAVKPSGKLAFDPTITHKVKKGETLSTISRKYDVKLSRLYRLNSMTNFDTLKIGQEVVIGYGQSKAEKVAFFKKVNSKTQVETTPKPLDKPIAKNKVIIANKAKVKAETKTIAKDTPKNKKALNESYAKRFALIVEKDPVVEKKITAKKVAVVTGKNTVVKYHTVTATETLYGISVRYKQPVDHLKKLNKLKDNTLFIGQKLRIK
ncbi:muramidase family protein [Tenacibaculum finnmarkense]|uniref:muramidase family protein n=1 Tax=Tenacibaculum finnmarkense TaxID=2781243 RepID=UPI0013565DCB|nr:LysM peptidoglycan-binding domain-containing protein [Tenacibaculum finnmarkense]MBE7692678.1 LysM peptidoglycan-binding domain-containing protein [Tenacibaculum finnmarkense genomovar finnmarkense]MCD8402916.1 LysM peptidoglycan-binding domain-containing protein [Tenacibaculum finnmarkense genomovar finnmarkense]MCD8413220.1 LysM peptidoglycan-binding domain-containing protein [Tenacibaculum finnmarkense genomovar ulcerans]MCD8439523.1 LysM peptidoglycan-binding domain-containing protein [T